MDDPVRSFKGLKAHAHRNSILCSMLTTKEAATQLGIKPGTLRSWSATNRGPEPVRYTARQTLYRTTDIAVYANLKGIKK